MTKTARIATALFLAATLNACVEDAADEVAAEPEIAEAPSADVQAAMDADFAAAMTARAARAEAYLATIIPDLDRALRTLGTSYAELQAELAPTLALADAEAIKAGLDRFYAAHGDQLDAAFESLGTTMQAVAENIRRAAFAGEQPVVSTAIPDMHRRGACFPGVQIGSTAPFLAAGAFVTGVSSGPGTNTAAPNGGIVLHSGVTAGQGASFGWVRSDNLPPVAAGTTVVTATASFAYLSAEVAIWAAAWSAAGAGLTIEVRNGGPQGPVIGQCRLPLIEKSAPYGYAFGSTSGPITFQCAVSHSATSYLSTRVIVDTYATHTAPAAGFAQSNATGQILSVTHQTCL